ncbi:hypothetical protein, partial [Xanthomonas vasicola]
DAAQWPRSSPMKLCTWYLAAHFRLVFSKTTRASLDTCSKNALAADLPLNNIFKYLLICFAGSISMLTTACGRGEIEPPTQISVGSDFGDLGKFHNCQAIARRQLSGIEKCEINLLKKECTPSADCLITCQSSPDGHKVGGGCYHLCFSTVTGHNWSEKPKADFSSCDAQSK